MKVSLNWLKDYLNLDKMSDKELFDTISSHISEIEDFYKLVEVTDLMIGEVLECIEHPNSDHLHVCQVKLKDGISQIVCGAPNVKSNQKVIVALPGAKFKDFTIKKSSIRGVESNGMICSLAELGIEEKYIPAEFKDGIFVLDEKAVVGADPLKYLGFDDTVIDLDLTSNRSDLLSVEGFAFDLGAQINQKVNEYSVKLNETSKENEMKVEISTSKCPVYYVRQIDNVVIKESPYWMKSRLIASGIRPINNVVDITNYVLMQLGQPLHAFDYDKLGNKILVREAKKDEKIVTLDNISRTLDEGDIIITDGKNPICVAGIMGGLSTEIDNKTTNIVLEAAYFDPLSIRKTSTRLGLKSDSSIRFERKIDPERIVRALDMAAMLLTDLAGGSVRKNICGLKQKEFAKKIVTISENDINKVLGTIISKKDIASMLERYQYSFKEKSDSFIVEFPSRRMDLEESKQDIIEDIVRMYGYEKIPTVNALTNDKGELTKNQKKIRNIRHILADMGLNETTTYSLITSKDLYDLTSEKRTPVELLMPQTEDRAVMRQSLLNGLLSAVSYNLARKAEDLAFFEIGNSYSKEKEELLLSAVICNTFQSKLWGGYKLSSDFFVLKGILDSLAERLNIIFEYETVKLNSNFHPGRSAAILLDGNKVGVIAGLHPRYAKEKDLDSETYVFELSLDEILKKDGTFKYSSINKFPTITRDLAVVIKKDVVAADLIKIIRQTAKTSLVDVSIFDLFEGGNMAVDEKSIAVKMIFEDTTKTMETAEVDKIMKSILNRLEHHFNAKLR